MRILTPVFGGQHASLFLHSLPERSAMISFHQVSLRVSEPTPYPYKTYARSGASRKNESASIFACVARAKQPARAAWRCPSPAAGRPPPQVGPRLPRACQRPGATSPRHRAPQKRAPSPRGRAFSCLRKSSWRTGSPPDSMASPPGEPRPPRAGHGWRR